MARCCSPYQDAGLSQRTARHACDTRLGSYCARTAADPVTARYPLSPPVVASKHLPPEVCGTTSRLVTPETCNSGNELRQSFFHKTSCRHCWAKPGGCVTAMPGGRTIIHGVEDRRPPRQMHGMNSQQVGVERCVLDRRRAAPSTVPYVLYNTLGGGGRADGPLRARVALA